jgi:hypothetical protein
MQYRVTIVTPRVCDTTNNEVVRCAAFLATEYTEVLSSCQPGKVVDHFCPRPQGADMDMVGKNSRELGPGQV